MTFDDHTFQQLIGLLDQRPEAREELRRRLLPDDGTAQALRELAQAQARTEQHLSTLTARVDQLGERMDQLAANMDQLTVRMDQLAMRVDQLTARIDQLGERMDQLAARMEQLAAAQARTEAALAQLATSVAGMREQGRGEEYERGVRLDAITMFIDGDGGAPLEPHVRSRVQPMVAHVIQSGTMVEEVANPMRADVIWWKNGHFLVAEVSIVVGMHDVDRAALRAATVRAAGTPHGVESVLPLVLGRRWSGHDAYRLAEELNVGWWIQDPDDISETLSPDLIAYRRLRPRSAE